MEYVVFGLPLYPVTNSLQCPYLPIPAIFLSKAYYVQRFTFHGSDHSKDTLFITNQTSMYFGRKYQIYLYIL